MCNTIDLSSKVTESLVDSSLTPQVRKVSMESKYDPVTSYKIVVIARVVYVCGQQYLLYSERRDVVVTPCRVILS
jgi:hypothetical protein